MTVAQKVIFAVLSLTIALMLTVHVALWLLTGVP